MRIIMLGLRGLPHVMGGVEAHVEHLCPLLRELGCEVEVIVRTPYLPADRGTEWKGVRYRRVWSPKSMRLEAIVHTFLGVLVAAVRRPDVLHIHAIGPALMTPLARLLGLRVVVTHHGPDYARQKWGRFAKWVLRTGEHWGMRFANGRIVISKTIQSMVCAKYKLESELIPNGVELPGFSATRDALHQFGLEPRRYVLMVSRFVPEKRHADLIEAFSQANLPGWKLVLVGGSDHPDDYSASVQRLAAKTSNVVATGIQTGKALKELYSHAGLFVLPSSHEGLAITLLEALSYGLPTLASDIPGNLDVGLPEHDYFPLGDTAALARRMEETAAIPVDAGAIASRREWISRRYNWDDIAAATLGVYRAAVSGSNPR